MSWDCSIFPILTISSLWTLQEQERTLFSSFPYGHSALFSSPEKSRVNFGRYFQFLAFIIKDQEHPWFWEEEENEGGTVVIRAPPCQRPAAYRPLVQATSNRSWYGSLICWSSGHGLNSAKSAIFFWGYTCAWCNSSPWNRTCKRHLRMMQICFYWSELTISRIIH